jgi:hypothetical protein
LFTIDDRLRGLPATREQVVALHQSINQPHLAIPGKQAGPAQAFIVGLRGSQGFAVFVYLFLPESADCALYVSDRRNLSPEEYSGEEAEALGFVESMGFILDSLNFRGLPQPQQDELVKTLPVFQRDPRQAGVPGAAKPGELAKPSAATMIGRLFSSF